MTADESPVAEVEVGEYDGTFAVVSGVVAAVVAAAAVFFLVRGVSLDLSDKASYAEQLRTIAVVAAVCVGVVLLAAGTWLAALEVRGRQRARAVTVRPAAAGLAADEVAGAVAKVLESASKMRGTVAVLVAGTALMLGALWAVGQPADGGDRPTPEAPALRRGGPPAGPRAAPGGGGPRNGPRRSTTTTAAAPSGG